MLTLVTSLLGVLLPPAAIATAANGPLPADAARPAAAAATAAGAAAVDPCGMCEMPSEPLSAADEGDGSSAATEDAAAEEGAVREICADAAESIDRRELAACEEEAERALRRLTEAGIPWGESELPASRPADEDPAPLCGSDTQCGPPPATPAAPSHPIDIVVLPASAPATPAPPSAFRASRPGDDDGARDGYARRPERPPSV
ncbi:MAG TPA: hypothetical protein VG389_01600 [Myxococcota bacterium]|jgi:hypothetical protein|nr:hypothetical protein [Myxococcota bacterium]